MISCTKIIAIGLFCLFAVGAADLNPIEFEGAINRGLGYLALQQQGDGSFIPFDEPGPHSAPTALALLAFLGSGHTPAAGQYDLVTHNAIDYLLRQAPDDGYLGRADGSGAEGQALITIALAESYGVETDSWQRQQFGPTLRSALQAIEASQDSTPGPGFGGWSDNKKGRGNLITTAWIVVALDALADAGFATPPDVLHHAAQFAQSRWTKLGFTDANQSPTAASNIAGVLILLLTEESALQDSQQKLLTDLKLDAKSQDEFTSEFMLAFCSVRLNHPARLSEIQQSMQRQQQDDNSWGSLPASATALLTLSMRDRYLPLFYR